MANVDLSKAEEGRCKLDLAATDMPGLSFNLSELTSSKPFNGCMISVCIDFGPRTALLIETLSHLGAQVHSANSTTMTPYSASSAAAVFAAIPSSVRIFLCAAPDLVEHWRCVDRCLDFHPDLILDSDGDLAYFLNNVAAAEDKNIAPPTA